MIQIYCGDGKGKTTAAAGLCVRGAGRGIPVLFVQFLKDGSSGEISVLNSLPGVRVMMPEVFHGFTWTMNDAQKEETGLCYARVLEQVKTAVEEHRDTSFIVVLDEVLHACNAGLLDEKALCTLLDDCPEQAEIVLTGQNPSEDLKKRADYISEMKKIKHPFDKGVPARKGIEN